MPSSTIIASARRRPIVAGWASLALHGGVVALAVMLARSRIVRPQRRAAVTDIEIVDAVALPRAPFPAQVAPPSPVVQPRQLAAHNRRGLALPQHMAARPSSVKQLLADIKVSYDDPANFTDRAAQTTPSDGGRTLHSAALTTGTDLPSQNGLATLQMPGVASASLARPPHAKHDYSKGKLESVRQFAGQTIEVLLTIDIRGHVRHVDLLKGVEAQLDARTIALVREWEFDPALDDIGEPMPGYVKWDMHLVDQPDE
jgi:hypothetical protein